MFKTFDFGSNWAEFSKRHVDRQSLETACVSMRALLGTENITGKSFIDIGCGSGLFSIAAHRLGAAKVVGIDVNSRCIEIARANRDLLAPGAPIEFHIASVLDAERLKGFGTFDLVYAWGSLHHTGAMWNAVHNVVGCVAPGATLVLAIYNKHSTSPAWRSIKWFYNQVPKPIQKFMIFIFAGVIYGAKFLVTRANPLKKERGMDFWFDVVDWVGGYPYEYEAPEKIKQTMCKYGFELKAYTPARVPTGCNEFVFSRIAM